MSKKMNQDHSGNSSNAPKQILVVDDDHMVIDVIVRILKRTRNQIDCAENGLIAFDKILENKPDLLVLDLRMPVLDGVGLLEKIKESQLDIFTIILTGHGDLDEAERLLSEFRIADFIQKPLNSPFQLTFSVENALERQSIEKQNSEQQKLLAEVNQNLLEEIEKRKVIEKDLINQKDIISSLLRESVMQSKELSELNSRLKYQKQTLVEQKSQILKQNQALARASRKHSAKEKPVK